MKKLCLIILASCLAQSVFSQKEMQKAIHKYYRYDPFDRSFSSFINNLLSDPALSNKTVSKRTDSALFFFRGDYKGHNPFGFKATRTEVRLAEMEIESSDTPPQKDTIMAYQLLGYASRTSKGMEAVRAEFERFDRKFGGEFSNKTTKDLVEGNHVEGLTCNYFLDNSNISPLTVIWGNISAEESIFAITIRLIKIENQAMLPMLYNQDSQEPAQ